MRFDEAQIDRGRKLHRLLGNEDFGPLLAEINDRIETFKNQCLAFRPGTAVHDLGTMEYRPRYQELQSLKEWIGDEIERGSEELMKKSAAQVELEASEK